MNEEVKTVFKFNAHVINKNLEDISQEESVITPDGGGSSINWILGHILITRDYLLSLFGLVSLCGDNMVEIYERGTQKVTIENAIDLKILLKLYNDSQVKIMKALDENDIRNDKEKMDNIPGLSFHEAYHAGQTAVLRRVIGKKGVIQ